MRINQPNTGGTAYQRGLLLASGISLRGERGKRWSVWAVPAGAAGRGIPEHDPRHKDAVNHRKATGERRWTDAQGTEWTVQEDN